MSEKKGLSLSERIRRRVEGGGGEGKEKNTRYLDFPPLPDNGKRIRSTSLNIAILGKEWVEVIIHWYKDNDGKFHVIRCTEDRSLPKEVRRTCLCCKHRKTLEKKGKKFQAEMLKGQRNWIWNAMAEGVKSFLDEESGERYCRIFQHKWTVFEGLSTKIIDKGKALTGPDRVWVEVTKTVKRINEKKNKTEYSVAAGENFVLPEKWKKLKTWDLNELYPVMEDDKIAEILGLSSKRDDEDDDDEGDDEDEAPKKKKRKTEEDLDEEDEDEDMEDLEEDEE